MTLRKKDILLGLFCFLLGNLPWSAAQITFHSADLHPPVKHPIRLSGTFGELRAHHFHYGLDIKSSNGESGDTIFAISDGFITRVIVESGRYGKGVWVEHPGGLTSQYAHLMRFTPLIDSIVLATQEARQAFEIDLNLPDGKVPVKKGDVIGLMGNTGHSLGTHLHFELWRSDQRIPLNPLLLGFSIEDPTPPIIERVDVHTLDSLCGVITTQSWLPSTSGDTVIVNGSQVGLGVLVYDPQNGGINKNGTYSISIATADVPEYEIKFDSIPLDVAGSYTGLIDYRNWIQKDEFVHRCYVLPALHGCLDHDGKNGIIDLQGGVIKEVIVKACDFFENCSEFKVFLQSKISQAENQSEKTGDLIDWDSSYTFRDDNYFFSWEKRTLYQSAEVPVNLVPDEQALGGKSLELGDINVPLKKPVRLGMKPEVQHGGWMRVTMVEREDGRKPKILGSIWSEGYLVAPTPSFGTFCLIYDTLPPSINLLERNLTSQTLFQRFVINDNLEHGSGGRGLRYRATLDGQWILAEFDLKSDQLSCAVDLSTLSPGQHVFQLLVTDFVGNRTIYDYQFNTN